MTTIDTHVPAVNRRMQTLVRIFSGMVRLLPTDNRLFRLFLLGGAQVFDAYAFDFTFQCPRIGVRWSAASWPEQLTKRLLFWGVYQHDVLLWLKHLSGKGQTVFDIGGFHGLMAIVASKAVGDSGRVITFEPNAKSRAHLLNHLRLNCCRNVTVESVGLMETEGERAFFPQAGDSSWNSSFVREFVDPKAAVQPVVVSCTTLDSYVERSGIVPDVVKIDTEGTEMNVLLGAKRTIAQHRPALLLEFNPDSAQKAGTSVDEIASFLGDNGYSLEMLTEKRYGGYSFRRRAAWRPGVETWDGLANVACIPSNRSVR